MMGWMGVQLDWSARTDTDIQKFQIYRATHVAVTQADILVAEVTPGDPYDPYGGGTNYTDTTAASTIPPGTTYYYRIFVVDNNDQSAGSNEESITLVDNPPAALTLDTPTYANDPMMGWTGVELSWNAATDNDIQSYKIYRSTSPGVTEESTLVTTIDPEYGDPHYGSTTSTLDPGAAPTVPPGTTYYYRVFVVDDAGQSTGSNEVSILLVDNPPTAVTLNELTYGGDPMMGWMGVQLAWSASTETDIQKYQIYRATHVAVTQADILVAEVTPGDPYGGGGTNYTDTTAASTIPPGTTYYYRIFVVDNNNQSVGSNEESITLVDAPPAALTLDQPVYDYDPWNPDPEFGSKVVQLSWSASTENDIQHYKLYRSTTPGVSEANTLVATIDPYYGDPYFGSTTSTQDFGASASIAPGSTYYYRIFVVDNAGQSIGSNEQSITLVDEPPVAVTLEPAVDVSTTISGPQVELSWTYSNDSDFQKYQLYRSTYANVTQSDTLVNTVTDRYPWDGDHWHYTDSPPDTGDPNLTYYYRVFIVDQVDQSTGSNEVSYVLPPGVPGFATFNNIGQTTLDASLPDLPARADSLTLQMKQASLPDSAFVDVATEQEAFAIMPITGLYAATDYTFRVIAVGPSGSTTGQNSGVSTADAPPPAPDAPTFSDLQPDSVIVHGSPLLPSTDYLRLEIKLAGQDDSTYMMVTDNLEGDSSTLVSGLSADANYVFRFVAVGRGGETPGASAQLAIPHVDYGWAVGTEIRCDGIRWPHNNATISPGTPGRLSSFLARDWDARNMLLGEVVIGSTVVTDPCSYTWSAMFADGTPAGSFPNGNTGQSVVWIAPTTPGTVTLACVVDDQNNLNKGNSESGARNDAALSYNDDPVTFTRIIEVE